MTYFLRMKKCFFLSITNPFNLEGLYRICTGSPWDKFSLPHHELFRFLIFKARFPHNNRRQLINSSLAVRFSPFFFI